jgi:hypothetical protein
MLAESNRLNGSGPSNRRPSLAHPPSSTRLGGGVEESSAPQHATEEGSLEKVGPAAARFCRSSWPPARSNNPWASLDFPLSPFITALCQTSAS